MTKKFTIILLGAIFVALIAGSVQSISADHESGKGIFKNEHEVELADTKNTNYQVYLQAVLRNGDGHLISVVESTASAGHIAHKLTDDIFDTLMGEKEIVIIDNIKYEKVQYVNAPSEDKYDDWSGADIMVEYFLISALMLCGEIHGHDPQCMPVFQSSTHAILLTETDVATNHWTILRVLD